MKENTSLYHGDLYSNRLVNAVGALIYAADTDRCLYLLRSLKQTDTWGLVGGKQEQGETLIAALHREFREEIGSIPLYTKLLPLETYVSPDHSFRYVSCLCVVEHEFIPKLNNEHKGYCWVESSNFPRPLHPGLWNTVNFIKIKDKIKLYAGVCQA